MISVYENRLGPNSTHRYCQSWGGIVVDAGIFPWWLWWSDQTKLKCRNKGRRKERGGGKRKEGDISGDLLNECQMKPHGHGNI